MTRRVISVGNAVVDLVARVDELPTPGADVPAQEAGLRAGGGSNALIAVARQGVRAVYAGAHGTGPLGDLVRAALRTEGVEVALPPTPDLDTGVVVALTDRSGERAFVTASGAEGTLRAEALRAVVVDAHDLVLLSGYGLAQPINGPAVAEWVLHLPTTVTVLYDPGPLGTDVEPSVAAAVASRVDWWSGNRAEAEAATGCADPVAAASALVAAGAGRGAMVRTGADGCILLAPGTGPVAVPGLEVRALDTNGAGDAHVGIWLAGTAHGLTPLAAAQRATVGAAIAVTRTGPATAPGAEEIDAAIDGLAGPTPG